MGTVSFDYTDETVVVTGGSSGIGRAIALAFGEAGATVLNLDLRPDSPADDAPTPTHERVTDLGGRGEFRETDVSDPEQLRAGIDRADAYGGVDVMVNNAGLFSAGPLESLSTEQVTRLFGVNVYGVLYGCQAAAANMIEHDTAGAIINTASVESDFARKFQSHYAASKGAVKMLTRAAALELAEHGIRVNAIAPGDVATNLGTGVDDDTAERLQEEGVTKPVPLGRSADPAEMAPPVLFLGSAGAGYVTGELFFVDGGLQVY